MGMLICYAVVDAKRSSVQREAERLLSLTRTITDTHLLDHALSTLSKLASSLQAHVSTEQNEELVTSFTTVDKFAPAQMNERQLQFKRTTNSAGRKQKMIPLV